MHLQHRLVVQAHLHVVNRSETYATCHDKDGACNVDLQPCQPRPWRFNLTEQEVDVCPTEGEQLGATHTSHHDEPDQRSPRIVLRPCGFDDLCGLRGSRRVGLGCRLTRLPRAIVAELLVIYPQRTAAVSTPRMAKWVRRIVAGDSGRHSCGRHSVTLQPSAAQS